ncbi:MAG: prepilin peptidase [Acidimicrobiales bacterium]
MTAGVELAVLSAVVGLSIGSFLNVVVHRVPLGQSLARPRSACPGCATPIAARDNVPVVSWLVLRGRCRHCDAPISLRYPLVEAGTAALFVAVAVRFGWSWATPAADAFVAGLLALACVDLERYLLPRRIVFVTGGLSGAFLLVDSATTARWGRLAVGAACAAVAFGLFWALNRANPRWLGYGDVRLAGAIGLVLGWLGPDYALIGFLVANLAGVIVAGVLLTTGRMRRTTPMPYGVFLAAGSVVTVLAGAPVAQYLQSHPI